MASIKRRRGKYHVVYYYLNEDGENETQHQGVARPASSVEMRLK